MSDFFKNMYYRISATRRGIIQLKQRQDELIEGQRKTHSDIQKCRNEVEYLTAQSLEIISIYSELKKQMKSLNYSIKPNSDRFSNHYELWRIRRVAAIVDHYGENWFHGKKILELGCGYGDIGHVFMTLGAEVIFAEGRPDNCEVLRRNFPKNRVYQMNCENEWPFPWDENFDLILHMGLLYHLDNFQFSLDKCVEHTNRLVIETEVCDSDNPDTILKIDENADGYDQSMLGRGSRPSGACIERYFQKAGWAYERITDSRCNAIFHVYDWPINNTNSWRNGLRRFWFCENPSI